MSERQLGQVETAVNSFRHLNGTVVSWPWPTEVVQKRGRKDDMSCDFFLNGS